MGRSGTVLGVMVVVFLLGVTIYFVGRASTRDSTPAPRRSASAEASGRTPPPSPAGRPDKPKKELRRRIRPAIRKKKSPVPAPAPTAVSREDDFSLPSQDFAEATSVCGPASSSTPPASSPPSESAEPLLGPPPVAPEPLLVSGEPAPEAPDPADLRSIGLFVGEESQLEPSSSPVDPYKPAEPPQVPVSSPKPAAASVAHTPSPAGIKPAVQTPGSAPPPPPPPPKPRYEHYTVKPGDCLWTIAVERLGDGRKWRDILRVNPTLGRQGERLKVGQTILLPVTAEPQQAQTPAAPIGSVKYYMIKRGDTLWEIAKTLYGDPSMPIIKEILAANPGLDPRALPVGKRINLPVIPGKGPKGL